MRWWWRGIWALFALLPVAALGGGDQPLETIAQAARDFLQRQTASADNAPTITIGQLDPRLHLPLCAEPLEAFLPAGSGLQGNTTVGVRCAAPRPWSLYVQASVRIMLPVVVAARPLPIGAVLQADDLKLVEMDLSMLTAGYYAGISDVVGMRVKRAVGLGVPINNLILEARKVIRRGERVTIIAETAGVEVRMAGEALTDGAKGDVIAVRNISSKREIEAVVISPGMVRVRM